MNNPLKENNDVFLSWLAELNDSEVLELLEIVSSDLKRRNNVSGSPSGENIQDYLKKFLYGSSKI